VGKGLEAAREHRPLRRAPCGHQWNGSEQRNYTTTNPFTGVRLHKADDSNEKVTTGWRDFLKSLQNKSISTSPGSSTIKTKIVSWIQTRPEPTGPPRCRILSRFRSLVTLCQRKEHFLKRPLTFGVERAPSGKNLLVLSGPGSRRNVSHFDRRDGSDWRTLASPAGWEGSLLEVNYINKYKYMYFFIYINMYIFFNINIFLDINTYKYSLYIYIYKYVFI